MLVDHVEASAAAGGFDGPDAVLERRSARLDAKGVAQLTLGASIRGKVTVTVTHATYRKLTKKAAV